MYTFLGVHVVRREGCMRNTPTGKKIGTPPKSSGRRVSAVQGIHGYSWLTS
jgi:hypothetical protein